MRENSKSLTLLMVFAGFCIFSAPQAHAIDNSAYSADGGLFDALGTGSYDPGGLYPVKHLPGGGSSAYYSSKSKVPRAQTMAGQVDINHILTRDVDQAAGGLRDAFFYKWKNTGPGVIEKEARQVLKSTADRLRTYFEVEMTHAQKMGVVTRFVNQVASKESAAAIIAAVIASEAMSAEKVNQVPPAGISAVSTKKLNDKAWARPADDSGSKSSGGSTQ